MESDSHRAVMLNPFYRVMDYGVAYDSRNWRVVAYFQTNLVDGGSPELSVNEMGNLRVAGSVTQEVYEAGLRVAGVEVYYDPPPLPLSVGRLARTAFYGDGDLSLALDFTGERGPRMSREYMDFPSPSVGEGPLDPVSEEEGRALFEAASGSGTLREESGIPLYYSEIQTRGAHFSLGLDAFSKLCPERYCESVRTL